MSFQAYLDNIKAKTGKTLEDFKNLAEEKGLLKPGYKAGDIVAWLKKDYELGHGHAMAIYAGLSGIQGKEKDPNAEIAKHFNGSKSSWQAVYEGLWQNLNALGEDVSAQPTSSYISILRGKKKFAVIYISAARMDIGIKRKNVSPTNRFEAAGNWNAMVTHRVQIHKPEDIDPELLEWLQEAYKTA